MKQTLLKLLLTMPLVASTVAQTPKGKLAPARVKAIKKNRLSYAACRREALNQLKMGSFTDKAFELALSRCVESYPGAGLYSECKKKAIKSAKENNLAPDKAIEQCQRYALAASFVPEQPLPFFAENGQLYFGGIGLNHQTPTATLAPPNFDCSQLTTIAKNPKDAQYFLFGNHPKVFAGLSELGGPAFKNFFKTPKKNKKGFDIEGFGRVFGDPTKPSGSVFFPSAACDFDSEPGDIFTGLSAYYLIDADGAAVLPYFGIAYYKQSQTAITTPKLVQSMLKLLGPNFKAHTKTPQVTFLVAGDITERDEDKDPKNLCIQPRQHRFVGVVQSRPGGGPEYALLANIKNLCDFGDRLAKRKLQ